jgi:hypothetical protein
MELIHFFLLGCVVAPAIYVALCGWSHANPDYKSIIECSYAGAGLVAGIHLLYCAFAPDSLVHLVALEGRQVDLGSVKVQMGQIHALDLAVGSIVLIVFTGGTIFSCCWRALGK